MGIEVRPALEAALGSPDPEVRDRVYHVLETVVQADEEQRWSAFIDDVDDTKHYDLPGWSRFRQLVGHDRAARQLFADMDRAEPDLFEAIDKGPDAATRSLDDCIAQEMGQAPTQIHGANEISLGSVSAMLFVGSDKHITLSETTAIQLTMILLREPAIRQAIHSGDQSAAVRRILKAWISHDATANTLYQNLWLAMQLNLKEGIEPAIHALRQPDQARNVKQIALLLIAKLGDRKDLPDVEAYMNDTSVCAIMVTNNQQQVQTQIRDVALAVEIKLEGQDPKSFGFDRLDVNGFSYDLPGLFGFCIAADREAAAKKWRAWVAAHPAPADAGAQANKR